MAQGLQQFLLIDDPTWTFLGTFLAVAAVLSIADFAWRRLRPARAPAPVPAEPVVRERRPRPAIVRFAIGFGKGLVAFVAGLPITPNQITVIGLVLVLFNCAVFVVSHNTFWFGAGLIGALLFDTMDGQVARAQGTSSRFGGYLDAVIDRYQEIVIYLAIGAVLDQWLLAFLIITGSMSTSYNKARVALEVDTDNKGWPDLLEKPMRLFILCTGLIGAPIIPWFLPCALWMLATMTHFTALQRFVRAYFLLADAPAPEAEA